MNDYNNWVKWPIHAQFYWGDIIDIKSVIKEFCINIAHTWSITLYNVEYLTINWSCMSLYTSTWKLFFLVQVQVSVTWCSHIIIIQLHVHTLWYSNNSPKFQKHKIKMAAIDFLSWGVQYSRPSGNDRKPLTSYFQLAGIATIDYKLF